RAAVALPENVVAKHPPEARGQRRTLDGAHLFSTHEIQQGTSLHHAEIADEVPRFPPRNAPMRSWLQRVDCASDITTTIERVILGDSPKPARWRECWRDIDVWIEAID